MQWNTQVDGTNAVRLVAQSFGPNTSELACSKSFTSASRRNMPKSKDAWAYGTHTHTEWRILNHTMSEPIAARTQLSKRVSPTNLNYKFLHQTQPHKSSQWMLRMRVPVVVFTSLRL
eukprot:1643799-Amphidinium_carterae.1